MVLALLQEPDSIIVLVIVLLLFGGAKLPGLARSLGEAQREFRKGQQGEESGAPSTSASEPPKGQGE